MPTQFDRIVEAPWLKNKRRNDLIHPTMDDTVNTHNAHKVKGGICITATHCALCNDPIEVGKECFHHGTAAYCSRECLEEDSE